MIQIHSYYREDKKHSISFESIRINTTTFFFQSHNHTSIHPNTNIESIHSNFKSQISITLSFFSCSGQEEPSSVSQRSPPELVASQTQQASLLFSLLETQTHLFLPSISFDSTIPSSLTKQHIHHIPVPIDCTLS